jgi:hypothetical protein
MGPADIVRYRTGQTHGVTAQSFAVYLRIYMYSPDLSRHLTAVETTLDKTN